MSEVNHGTQAFILDRGQYGRGVQIRFVSVFQVRKENIQPSEMNQLAADLDPIPESARRKPNSFVKVAVVFGLEPPGLLGVDRDRTLIFSPNVKAEEGVTFEGKPALRVGPRR